MGDYVYLIVPFNDATRQTIIDQYAALGLRLYEEQRYIYGDWLLFTDAPYVELAPVCPFLPLNPVMSLPEKVAHIEEWLQVYSEAC